VIAKIRSLRKSIPMRSFKFITAAFALSLCVAVTLPGQTTVSTVPVGFYTLTAPAGRTSAFAMSLDNLSNFQGAVSAVTTNTIQTTNAGWNNNAYGDFTNNPHIVRMLTGTSAGRQFQIASNTADTLTLNASNVNSGVAVGDSYAILPVDTLSSIFGGTGLYMDPDPNKADNVLVRGTLSFRTYFHNGQHFLIAGDTQMVSQDTAAILPEQGFLIVRRSTTPQGQAATALTLTRVGSVPASRLKTDLPANRTTPLPNRFPVDTTLGALGLQSVPGWLPHASDAAQADNVQIRSTLSWQTFYFDNSHWVLAGDTGHTSQDSKSIPIGTLMLVTRRPGANITFDQTLPYSLN
jgi:uncharacterized protein (TIGR02597 family)